MFCTFESVTVGVSDLESSVRFFRDRLGLRLVYDTRASVGLLSAWRRAVHESVRLVELAGASKNSARIRLACFEDSKVGPATNDRGRESSSPATGPWAIEFRGSDLTSDTRGAASSRTTGGNESDRGARTSGVESLNRSDESVVVVGPDTLPLMLPKTWDDGGSKSFEIEAVRIATADPAAATAFYSQALGFNALTGSKQAATAFGANTRGSTRFLLMQPDAGAHTSSMGVGQLGFNLFTLRCADLDDLAKRVDALGIEPVTRPTHVGLPVGYPGRVMIVPGPNGELFELDELDV